MMFAGYKAIWWLQRNLSITKLSPFVECLFLPEHFSERVSEFLHLAMDILVQLDRARDVRHGNDEAVTVSQGRVLR